MAIAVLRAVVDLAAIVDMADNTSTPEIEETLETALVTRLASVCTVPVTGFLAPSAIGTEKRLTADTFVGVTVDRSSQDGDYAVYAPFTMSATVSVHYAQADDASGADFRDECRRVSAALLALIGDGCTALESAAVQCDSFTLGSTSSSFEGGENPTSVKSYTATIKCRKLTMEA